MPSTKYPCMQRKIVNVNGKDLEAVIVDPAWMRQKYEQFRGMFFSTVRMPDVGDISLEVSTRMKRAWGRAWWKDFVNRSTRQRAQYDQNRDVISDETKDAWGMKQKWLEGEYVRRNIKCKIPNNPDTLKCRIQLNTREFLPEVVYEGVLVHEMVHVCCYCNRMWTGEGHDGWFRKIGDYITNASDGKYKIERYVSQDDIDIRDMIRDGVTSASDKDGWVIRLHLDKPIDYHTRTKWFRTKSMWYWISNVNQINGFLAKASMNPDKFLNVNSLNFVDLGINSATIYEAIRSNISDPRKQNWVQYVRDRCLEGNPAGNPPFNDNIIAKWNRLDGCDRFLEEAGALKKRETVTDLFKGAEVAKEPEAETMAADAPAEPTPEPNPPAEQDPMERIKAMSSEERKRFFDGFYPWYKSLDPQQKGMLEDNGHLKHPDWSFQQVLADYYFRKFFDSPVQQTMDFGESFDYTDNQKLGMLTESLLGRMYDRAKDWFKNLISSVFSSLWGSERIIDNGDGTVWRVIS